MTKFHLKVTFSVIASSLVLLCASCTAAQINSVAGNTSSTQHPVPLNSLCAVIDDNAIGQEVTGEDGAIVAAAPLYPQGSQIAGCEYANPAEISEDILDITLGPTMRGNINQFARIQKNHSFTQFDVNGFGMVGDAQDNILYLRFTDTNPILASNTKGTDSILTLSSRTFPVDAGPVRPITPDGSVVQLAEQVADDINKGAAQDTSAAAVTAAPPERGGPMLIDDRGRPVPNPVEVVVAYEALVKGDTDSLGPYGLGIANPGYWQVTQMPYLNQASVRAQIAKSMTVHPNCDEGCTYPGFAITGWNFGAARADGLKLGVDPAKVPNPKMATKGLPVYASIFPQSSDIGWNGTVAPGS